MGNTLELEGDINKTIKNLNPSTTSDRTFRWPNSHWANSNIAYRYIQDGDIKVVLLNSWRNIESYPFSFTGTFQSSTVYLYVSLIISGIYDAEIESTSCRGVYNFGEFRSPWLPCFYNSGIIYPIPLTYQNIPEKPLTAISFQVKYKQSSIGLSRFMSKLYSMLPFTGTTETKIEETPEENENNEENENMQVDK